jgi:hypothetical protein
MSDLKDVNRVPNGILETSEDPLGLSTAHIGPQEQKPRPISLLYRRVSIYTLLRGSTQRNYWSPPMRRGGGIRDRVRGFSRASRRNLLRHLASINRSAFRAFKGRIIFVTLTYPKQFPEDPELCKRDLTALRKRLERRYKSFAAFWRMGIQRRGHGTSTCFCS